MKFSEQVRIVRKKLQMNQAKFAEALNVSIPTINRWEKAKVQPSNLAKKTFEDFCENNFIDISKT